MNKLKRIPEGWLAAVILICLALLFFSPVLSSRVLFAGDNLSINVPSKVLFFRMLKSGQLPLWNPYTFAGSPFLADINLGLLSPFNLFYLFLSPLRALTASVISAVILGGMGTYFYARRLRLGFAAGLVSALVFMLSGSMMTHTLNTAVLNTVAWLPLIFFFIECLLQERKLKYSLLVSIALSLSLFGGHVQYFYYILLLSLAYILAQPLPWKRKLVYIAYIYIPALFLTTVQWVPFLQYAAFSTRPAQSLGYAGSVSPISFIQLLVPNFFGIVKDGTSWGATADINGYVGIIPLIMAGSALFMKKTRLTWFFLIAAAVSLLVALGRYSPLYLFAFYILPFFSRFRSPAGILIIYSFSLAVLAGASLERIKKIRFGFALLLISAVIAVAGIRLNSHALQAILPVMKTINNLKQTAFITRFLEYSHDRDRIIFSLWSENIALIGFCLFSLTLVYLAYQKKILSQAALRFIVFFLIASDLFFFAGNDMVTAPERELKTPEAVIRFLKADTGPYRILTYPDPGAKPPFADPAYFENEAFKALDILHPNTNILSGIESVGGYASVVRRDYARYISPVKTTDPTGISLPLPGSRQIDELNVKYILTAGNGLATLSATPQYKQVFSYHDSRIGRTVNIFKNNAALPRAYLMSGAHMVSGVQKLRETASQVRVQVKAAEPSLLVLSEINYPGWSVTVDGKKAAVETYHQVYRSVRLTPGTHLIVFSYIPPLLMGAALVSIVNWLYLLGFLAFLLQEKKIGKELHVSETEIKADA